MPRVPPVIEHGLAARRSGSWVRRHLGGLERQHEAAFPRVEHVDGAVGAHQLAGQGLGLAARPEVFADGDALDDAMGPLLGDRASDTGEGLGPQVAAAADHEHVGLGAQVRLAVEGRDERSGEIGPLGGAGEHVLEGHGRVAREPDQQAGRVGAGRTGAVDPRDLRSLQPLHQGRRDAAALADDERGGPAGLALGQVGERGRPPVGGPRGERLVVVHRCGGTTGAGRACVVDEVLHGRPVDQQLLGNALDAGEGVGEPRGEVAHHEGVEPEVVDQGHAGPQGVERVGAHLGDDGHDLVGDRVVVGRLGGHRLGGRLGHHGCRGPGRVHQPLELERQLGRVLDRPVRLSGEHARRHARERGRRRDGGEVEVYALDPEAAERLEQRYAAVVIVGAGEVDHAAVIAGQAAARERGEGTARPDLQEEVGARVSALAGARARTARGWWRGGGTPRGRLRRRSGRDGRRCPTPR